MKWNGQTYDIHDATGRVIATAEHPHDAQMIEDALEAEPWWDLHAEVTSYVKDVPTKTKDAEQAVERILDWLADLTPEDER